MEKLLTMIPVMFSIDHVECRCTNFNQSHMKQKDHIVAMHLRHSVDNAVITITFHVNNNTK